MLFSTEFISEIKARAADRCECGRSDCHGGDGRCHAKLSDEASWSPVLTGERLTFPPAVNQYIALCGACAVPRNVNRPANG